MITPRASHKYRTTTVSPRQSLNCSPTFSRSERKTQQVSFENLKTEIKEEIQAVISSSSSRNFIKQKSQILLRIDNKLQEQIKRKITSQKLQSKMSILSMQRTKFKINRNNSMTGKIHSGKKFSIPTVPQFMQSLSTKFEISDVHPQPGRYPFNFDMKTFKSYLRLISLKHPKSSNERKSELISRILVDYFISADEKQAHKDLLQIKSISSQLITCLTKANHLIDLNILRLIDRDISKLVFNMCYQIYRKRQKVVSLSELININKEIQYTARRLKFFQLVLKTCFDLGKLYCDQMEYEKAFQEYTNALKLAIHMESKYYQEFSIDKLGICKYYLGDSVSALYFHSNVHHLSQYDLNRIRAEYSNDDEIQRLIEEKRQFKKITQKVSSREQKRGSKRGGLMIQKNKENLLTNESFEQKVDIGEFTFVKQNRNQFYPTMNNHQLKNNLKKIIKIPTLRDKIHILKRNLSKNDLIGTKKYCGQNYIVPTASIFCRKQNAVERNEVCLSHRSYNRNDLDQQMAEINQDCKTILLTLNYFINQNIMSQEVVREEVENSLIERSQFSPE